MRWTLVLVSLLAVAVAGHAQTACNAPTLPLTGNIVNVSNDGQLQAAMSNLQAGDTILLADGTYHLNVTDTLFINGKNNVTIRGTSGCDGVVLMGLGMDVDLGSGNVPHGVWSNSLNTTIAHLTIRDTWDNTLIFNSGAQSPHVYSVKLLNSGSQFIKANPTDIPSGNGVNNGIVEYSWMEYTNGTPADHGAGVGYTNGISAHAADNWIIRGNVFKNFHTPDNAAYLWNPAVLMWNHSTNTTTERNTFINVDRAVAYGLFQNPPYDHQGGVIRNNFVYLQPNLMSPGRKAGSDGSIIAWDSANTSIDHNTILANDNIFYAIEFRFSTSTNGNARNNLSDLTVHLRDLATATLSGNLSSATPGFFVNPAAADLHLLPTASLAIDQAATLLSVIDDFDGNSRPQGGAYDIGADEYLSGVPAAANDNYTTEENTPLIVAAPGVLSNDTDAENDPLTAILDNSPVNGSLTLNSDGSFTYTPNTDFAGSDSFTYHANDGATDSNIATVSITIHPPCLFCDDFNDGVLASWTSGNGWSESGGLLTANPPGKKLAAIASVFSGCLTCAIESAVAVSGGAGNKVWLFGWYVDKKNTMELLIKEPQDKVLLRERIAGHVVKKQKISAAITPNSSYVFRIAWNGSEFTVLINGSPVMTFVPAGAVPTGTTGFQVANTTASFDYIQVE